MKEAKKGDAPMREEEARNQDREVRNGDLSGGGVVISSLGRSIESSTNLSSVASFVAQSVRIYWSLLLIFTYPHHP